MRHPTFYLTSLLFSLHSAHGLAATLHVGSGQTYSTPCKAFAVARAGDAIDIQAGTYNGDVCAVRPDNLIIRGVGGRPKIVAAGKSALDKATWVIQGDNITVDNVDMSGSRVPDKNGAAFRLEGSNFTLRNSFIHDNENGILSGVNTSSTVTLEHNEFSNNGYGDGYSHNLYIGKIKKLVFRFNYSHDANVGHGLKSRALLNVIAYNRFSSARSDEPGADRGRPSYEIDIPSAGSTYIIGNVIMQPSRNNNPALIAYGEEGARNAGHDLYVVNNTFLNEDTARATYIMIGSKVSRPALIQNNLFAGPGAVTNQDEAIRETNFQSLSPGFVDQQAYDLVPLPNPMIIDAGSAPATPSSGISLTPEAIYTHPASGAARPVDSAIDIGAYEAPR